MLKKYNLWQLLLISALSAIFVIYPDITWLPFELKWLGKEDKTGHIAFFLYRYTFFFGLIFILIRYNLNHLNTVLYKKRLGYSILISVVAYALYGAISLLVFTWVRHFGSLVLFQVLVVSVLSSLLGHIVMLYTEKRKKEKQIEDLTVKNLQSRYDALTNQINPHFFFNSLNGLTSLIRKKNDEVTLAYVDKLSDVFRYILQSDKKGLVTLEEELAFVDSFRYMMEVRFANKLDYNVNVDTGKLTSRLPVLSILPLLDNVVVHNIIDSDHKMTIDIYTNDKDELVISSPIYPKLTSPLTNGSGLKNLESRFLLLMDEHIKVEDNGNTFTVYLPLK
ncbi:sensor histidine kinase [Olivibacter sp. XZL3]|uniref:sensor histidine kinase n=1 Tax=Olivibacter sp. XZL3 TaxID=1735116 RepID=UPI001065646F|nr:histidine kinase [Olivibacter sp. XZL3]